MKTLDEMTAVEIANYEFSFYPVCRNAVEVRRAGILECEVLCEDGTVLKAMGLLAHELGKALTREEQMKTNTEQEMSDIQKQCWDNYHATWTKKDFEESDKAFIEKVKESMSHK